MDYNEGLLGDKILHGGDYNPEQWLDRPDILEADILMMQEAHINTVTLGVFSWSTYEPEEGHFHFEWLDKIVDSLYEAGISFILATPTGARPAWMDAKYPEILRVDRQGNRRKHGVRHNHCMSSEVYRQKAREMDKRLAKRYGSHPGLLMWHVSNEFGGECCCPACEKKFRTYLEDKYISIEKLNKEWWTTFWSHNYQTFDQIEIPSPLGENSIHGMNLDWQRFTTWNMTDYMKEEIKVLKDISPHIPITTNFMRKYGGLDYQVMAKELDLISWDIYPELGKEDQALYETMGQVAFDHAIMRGLKDRPFLLMEMTPSLVNWHPYNKLKRPEIHKLTAMQALACGSDSVLYFQWRKGRGSYEQFHGAVVDHLGRSDTRIFQEVKTLGKDLEALDEIVGSKVKSPVAIIFDWENRWAIKDMAGLSKDKKYDETVSSIYEDLLSLGLDPQIVHSQEDLSEYDLVIAPMVYLLKPKTSRRLKTFVNQGGILLATYLTGYVNVNTLCYEGGFPGDGLTELFGLYSEEIDTLYPGEFNETQLDFMGHKKAKLYDYCEILKPGQAEILSTYEKDFYKGSPLLTRNHYGQGQAWYLGARMERSGMKGLLRRLCQEAGIKTRDLPQGLEVHERVKGDKAYRFYLNLNREDLSIELEDGKIQSIPGLSVLIRGLKDIDYLLF